MNVKNQCDGDNNTDIGRSNLLCLLFKESFSSISAFEPKMVA